MKSKTQNPKRARCGLRPKILAEIGEAGWIERVGRILVPGAACATVGFGDDTACLPAPGADDRQLLFTTDVLIEGTHFTWKTATPTTLGEKAVAVNVSDVAAMGGRPVAMIVALGAPASFPVGRLEALFRSIKKTCDWWEIELVGGDTVRSERLVIAPALLGEFDGPAERLPLRNRLRPGQHLYVTGALGDSAAGLAILLSGKGDPVRQIEQPSRKQLIDRHRRPRPRLAEGLALVENLDDLAMIDLSDDLCKSIGLMCEASGVGAAIRLDRLPTSPALRRFCRVTEHNAVEMAVGGGEDFELLFATSAEPRAVRRIFRNHEIATGVQSIGKAGGKRIRWLDRNGRSVRMEQRAYEHFAAPARERKLKKG